MRRQAPTRAQRRPLRRTALLATALAVATVLAACAGGTGQAADDGSGVPDRIRIGYQSIPNGDLVVKHNGWLEEALPDTQITWTRFESGGDVNTAFIAGAIDIGLAGSSPVTRGLSAPLRIPYQVAWIHNVIGDAESLVAREDTGIEDVAGLVGRKVATPFALTAHYSLLAALAENDVDPAAVTLVDLEPNDILAAWQRGDIDAAYVWSPVLDELLASGTVLTTLTEIAAAGYPTFDLGVVTTQFAQRYPEALHAWLREQDRAVALLLSDPDEAAIAIGAELNLDPDIARAQTQGLVFVPAEDQLGPDHFGTPDAPGAFADGLLASAQFLSDQNRIDEVPTLAELQAGLAVTEVHDAFAGS